MSFKVFLVAFAICHVSNRLADILIMTARLSFLHVANAVCIKKRNLVPKTIHNNFISLIINAKCQTEEREEKEASEMFKD